MKRVALAFVAACTVFAACLPRAHELEGKACSDRHPCPDPLSCVESICLLQEPLVDAGFLARVRDLQLIDVGTKQAIYPYTPMTDGMSIPRSALPKQGVNILAMIDPERVSNVDFAMFGTEKRSSTENNFPYYFLGDKADGGLNAWKPDAGSYRLQVTPFIDGGAGDTAVITFTITPN